MDKSYLENQMGVKLYTLMEFAEFLGWTHQRLSKVYQSQQKGKKVRTPLPDPVHIGFRGNALLWTEGQVQKYKANIRPNLKPEWREIDGKNVYGRVCRICGEFKPIEDMCTKNSPYCYVCESRKGGEKRRASGEVAAGTEFKPKGRVHIRKYDAKGRVSCRTCKEFKDVSEFRIGTSLKLKPDCKDCINRRRRELYAEKGETNE